MADKKEIQNRIKSVKDTRKITNAMYLISSTKLRKARKSLDETRPFFKTLRSEISRIVNNIHVDDSIYFRSEGDDLKDGKCGILVITADKGLAGSYNQNVIRKTQELISEFPDYELFVSGEYGKHFFSSHGIEYDRSFNYPDVEPTLYTARMMAGYIMEKYDTGLLKQVIIVYTDFKNALSSEVAVTRLLPFEVSHFKGDGPTEDDEFEEYEYMPSPREVMDRCIPVYCIGMIYSVLVYAFCCEQNDRMMAMDNANQNADRLLKELTLTYNRLRQDGITQEITEISANVSSQSL